MAHLTEKSDGLSRDLEMAKGAYKKKNVEQMIQAHSPVKKLDGSGHTGESHAGESGEFIKSLVFGGLDGIITTFAIVSAAVGANMGFKAVVVMGLANLVADAISMGLGDALSEKAEMEYVKREFERETWEMENSPEGEKQEMVELYEKEGFNTEDANAIINIMSKNEKFFVKHMMTIELEMMPPAEDDNPWSKGGVTFGAFIVFGSVPLLSYVIFAQISDISQGTLMIITTICTAIGIFTLGTVKGKFAEAPMAQSGLAMLGNGLLAAGSSYLLGWGLEHLVPDE